MNKESEDIDHARGEVRELVEELYDEVANNKVEYVGFVVIYTDGHSGHKRAGIAEPLKVVGLVESLKFDALISLLAGARGFDDLVAGKCARKLM